MTALGLGTVQFGMAYGVSNTAGRVAPEGVAAILARAQASGVQVLDTAAEYGDSERALGEALAPGHAFRIVTKTPRFPADASAQGRAETATSGLEVSLGRLKQPSVYALLVHDPAALSDDEGDPLWQALERLREQGLVQKIGFSAYTEDEIDTILGRYTPDLVQVPVSILDQRLIQSGHLAALKARGVEIHARSVFLQGLLLMSRDARHAYFRRFEPVLTAYDTFLAEHDLTSLRAALAFIASVPEVDVALVGVTSVAELDQCVEAARGTPAAVDFSRVACDEPGLLNPALWKLH